MLTIKDIKYFTKFKNHKPIHISLFFLVKLPYIVFRRVQHACPTNTVHLMLPARGHTDLCNVARVVIQYLQQCTCIQTHRPLYTV